MPKPPGTFSRIANQAKIGHVARRDKNFVRVARQTDIDGALQRLDMSHLKAQHRRLAAFIAGTRMSGGDNEEQTKTFSDALELVDDLAKQFHLEDFERLYGVKIDPVLLGKNSGVSELICEIRDLRGELGLVQGSANATLKGAKHGDSTIMLAIALCKFMAIVSWLLDRKKH